jgi:predicted 3-demethylubiquinone-9 3-methyltransferase (glyoxalase superfamily)
MFAPRPERGPHSFELCRQKEKRIMTQEIFTFLMFEGKAEEAMNFYVSLFPGASVTGITRYSAGQMGKEGSVMYARFTLAGQQFMCIDSPAEHGFTFTPSMSIYVECAVEAEVDALFAALSEGGQVFMPLGSYPFSPKYGWLADRYGVSWQLSLRNTKPETISV